MNTTRPELNPDLARQFLETIYPSYIKEATRPAYIEVRGKRRSDVKLTFRRFYLGIDLLIKDMSTWSADRHYWFGVAPRWSRTQGKKEHCLTLTVIFTDVDYGTAGHKKKNRWQTREEAQAAIDAFPIKPSIIVHTGCGFQVYWILKEPFEFKNGNYARVEAIMKGIGAAIGGDDGTQDVSRIFRIPGTLNVKTDEPRPVEIVDCHPDRIYDLADFAHYANQDQDQDQDQDQQEVPPRDGQQTTNIDELNVSGWVKGLIRTGDASGYESRNERDHAVIGALKRAGRNLDTIEAIFRENPVGDKYKEKGNQGRKYLALSYNKAPENQPKLNRQIERLNLSHAVAQISGKTVILNEIEDHTGRPDITFSSVNDFRNFQANNRVWVNAKSVPVAQLWLESPDRRQYPGGVVFSPGQDTRGAYNLWRGFAVIPAPGDWSLYREHMLNNICAGNEALFNYLLDWMARNVQDPGGERPGVAVVLKSVDFGTGKGVFTTQYGMLFGPHFRHITNGMQLLGKFNNHLKDCLLCFVDEGVWGGDKQAAGVLKGLITERVMMIEPKGINAFPVENHINLIIASNNDWVVPAGFDERRYLVLDVSPKRKQDTEYFGAIVDQMERTGRAAMLYDLLERKITVDLRKVPKTAALLDQVVHSMTTVQKFWFERLRSADEWPKKYVLKEHIFGEYHDFAKRCGDRYPLIDQQLGKALKVLCPGIRNGRITSSQSRYRVYFLPKLDVCRKYFEKAVGVKVDWGTEDLVEDENED